MNQDKESVDYRYNNYSIHASKSCSLASLTQPPQSKPIKVIHPNSLAKFDSLRISETFAWNKPFLGGYIDRTTDVKYHNAHSQHPFMPSYKKQFRPKLLCRQTQTVNVRNTKQQTTHTQRTQMDRSDLHMDHSNDIDQPLNADNAYIDAKEDKLLQIECCVKIQCALRSFLARNKLKQLQNDKNTQAQAQKSRLKQQQKTINQRNKCRRYKKRHPVHSHQFKQIIDNLTNNNNKVLMQLIGNDCISKQAKHRKKSKMIKSHNKQLRNLQQKQLKIQQKQKRLRKENLLKQMMSPKTWIMSNGRPLSVRTPTTHRAEQLIFIYNALKDKTLTCEHRLALLDSLGRKIQSEIDLKTPKIRKNVREIFELIEREKDMISRERPKKSFRGLRTRLIHKYFDLLLIPQFNPEAARFSKTPRHVSNKIKPKLVAKGYKKRPVRRHALTPNTKTFVQFNHTI